MFAVGLVMVAATVGSAVRTVVLPRGIPARLSSFIFVNVRKVFRLRLRGTAGYEDRDRVMALYGPLSLLTLALAWLVIVLGGYGAMFWALGAQPVREAFTLSGSSLFTLGFVRPDDLPKVALAFSEAALGLTLAALLITYLPSVYAAFSRREAMVTLLEVRAGSPPSGVEMLERFSRIDWLDELDEVFTDWESWFVELEETHTSLPALVFFRSPQPDHSWVTASGAVLDCAALIASCSPERRPRAELCVRAGYLALRRIADFFGIPYEADPDPSGPITVARDEFEEAFDRMAAADVPVVPDRDQAWRDFVGWRVNYDAVLVTLAGLVMAPYAPWSSDRSAFFRVRVLRRDQSRRQ
ncbi:MAG: hypothetical protein LC733_00025 [Actinobacteria bacterium]|nr:hypothetical protein [Actinomycetota bacterium]